MRLPWIVLVSFLAAGCSDPSPAQEPAAPSSTGMTSAPGNFSVPVEVPTTDVLYLASYPTVRLEEPTAASPDEVAMAATGPPPEAVPREELKWTYVVASAANLTMARATVWVRVTEPLAAQPEGSIIRPWVLAVQLDGVSRSASSPPFGPTIPPGDYELTAEIDLGSDFRLEPGNELTLMVATTAVAPVSQRVLVLVGSIEFPSRFQLDGLREPVPET